MEPLEMFIPAMAIQHPGNPEDSTLSQRICWAVLRWHQNKDFDSLLVVQNDPLPYVTINTIKLNKEKMGYDITCKINSR